MSKQLQADGTHRPLTVGIFGHYGNENLGDEAIIEAAIQAVRTFSPTARICGFSINPADTAQRYGIPAFPIRYFPNRQIAATPGAPSRGATASPAKASSSARSRVASLKDIVKRIPLAGRLLRSLRSLVNAPGELAHELRFLRDSRNRIRDVDLLLVSGSNQFLDNFGGVWGFPYTLLKWSILAKLTGAKLAFLSVGAGPIDSAVSRAFVRTALRLSDYASFRDEASRQLIENRKGRRFGDVFPDLAHGLTIKIRDGSTDVDRRSAKRPTVGINPMPVYDRRYWHAPDDDRYWEYVGRLASFASMLCRDGYDVFFFPTQARDESVIRDILKKLDEDVCDSADRNDIVRDAKSVSGLMDVYAEADIIVATRFHGVLLALRAERPVLGICYFRKTRDLLRDMGQEACAVDLETFTASDLYERLKTLETNRAEALVQIRERGETYRAELRAQYAQVLELLVDLARESA